MDRKSGAYGQGVGANRCLDVYFLNELGVFLDECKAQFGFFAHQLINQTRRFTTFDFIIVGVVAWNGDADQGPVGLGHRGFF